MSTRKPRYHGHRFPSQIISYSIWLYYRFSLSFRDVEDLLAERWPDSGKPELAHSWVGVHYVQSRDDFRSSA